MIIRSLKGDRGAPFPTTQVQGPQTLIPSLSLYSPSWCGNTRFASTPTKKLYNLQRRHGSISMKHSMMTTQTPTTVRAERERLTMGWMLGLLSYVYIYLADMYMTQNGPIPCHQGSVDVSSIGQDALSDSLYTCIWGLLYKGL